LPLPYYEKDAIFWLNMAHQGLRKGSNYIFAINLKSDPAFIGGISLSIEPYSRALIGYWIAEPFWNLGYATEATTAIIKFGFEQLNLHKIYSNHMEQNPSSGKVMIKNGMIKEAELKDHISKDGNYHTLIQYEYSDKNNLTFKNYLF